jgi:hypothetical protein
VFVIDYAFFQSVAHNCQRYVYEVVCGAMVCDMVHRRLVREVLVDPF